MNDQNDGTRLCTECGSDYNPDTCVLARCPAFQEEGVSPVTRAVCRECGEEASVDVACEHPQCPSIKRFGGEEITGVEASRMPSEDGILGEPWPVLDGLETGMPEADSKFFFTDPPNLRYEEVDHPDHYNKHPSGVECINIIEHMSFNLGSAMKYIWRNGLKPGQDWKKELKKAVWYIEREIDRIEREANKLEEGR